MGRRLVYWALVRNKQAAASYLEGSRLILPRALVRPLAPAVITIMARHHEARDEAVRQDLAALPGLLDRIDGWIVEGVLGAGEPNVADYQVATSLALLMSLDDLRPVIEARPAGRLARRLAPDYRGRMPAAFPPAWLT
jgi:glutathione S-transferase